MQRYRRGVALDPINEEVAATLHAPSTTSAIAQAYSAFERPSLMRCAANWTIRMLNRNPRPRRSPTQLSRISRCGAVAPSRLER